MTSKLTKAAAEVKERSQEKETATTTAAQSGGVKTPPEQPEFIKQALIIIEKKVRNLEKRRQKLDEYRALQTKQTLNEDQLSAVSRYDEVIRTLDLSRELEKQFISLANDAMKQQKKQAKKEQTEREEAIKEKIKETQKYLTVLDVFGQENVRTDFLSEQNGAIKITQVELETLDEFNKIARPTEISGKLDSAASESADHLVALVDAKNKQIANLVSSASSTPITFTYSELRKLLDRVLAAPYWTNQQQATTTAAAAPAAADATNNHVAVEQAEQVQQTDNQVQNDVHHHQHQHQQQQQQQLDTNQLEHGHHEAAMLGKMTLHAHDEQLQYQQHSVLEQVSSNDLSDKNQQQQANAANPKTFFTTLNPADLHRNINEFISDESGINFLQDSEIQALPPQQQQAYHVDVQQAEHHQQGADGGLHYQPQQHIQQAQQQQPQQMHPNMQSNNYGGAQQAQQQQYVQMNQDFNSQDMSKDGQGGYRGPRGAGNHQGGGGGQRNYAPRPQRYDDRPRGPRNGGAGGPPGPSQQGGQGPRNPSGPYNGGGAAQRQGGMNGGAGGNGAPQGSGGGYRGQNSNTNNYPQNRQGGGAGGPGGAGGYRGGNRGGNVPPRQGGGGGGYQQQQQPQAV